MPLPVQKQERFPSNYELRREPKHPVTLSITEESWRRLNRVSIQHDKTPGELLAAHVDHMLIDPVTFATLKRISADRELPAAALITELITNYAAGIA